MSCIIKIHPDNSISYEMTLTNDGAYVNDATVTVTITDSDDVNVTGETWPVTMTYETGSNGVYSATSDPISGIAAGSEYNVIFDVTGSGGLVGQWVHTVTASTRGCD